MRFSSLLMSFAAAILSFGAMANAQSYTVTDLGTLAGTQSYAAAINDAGQVVGSSFFNWSNAGDHAFLWTSATGMQDLGTLGGFQSYALGINNLGQVVGCADPGIGTLVHAFLWTQSGGMQDLGKTGFASCAYAINDAGQVVGYTTSPDYYQHAFVWSATTGMQNLDVPLGAVAVGINSSGVVTGSFPGTSGWPRAFQWTATGGMQNLGSLGSSGIAQANAINAAGEIVGTSETTTKSDQYLAFQWTSGNLMLALPSLAQYGATAAGINDSGVTVGFSLEPGLTKPLTRAVVWDTSATIYDLNQLVNNSPLLLEVGNAINNTGQIVGSGRLKSGVAHSHAYLATPTGN